MRRSERSRGQPAAGKTYLQRLTPIHDEGLRRRLWGIGALIMLGFVVLLARAWQLQVIEGARFLQLSEQNRLRDRPMKSLRGRIFDRHGRILADNRPAYALLAMPDDLPDADALRASLQQLDIAIEPATLDSLGMKVSLQPIAIQQDVRRDQVAYFAEHWMDFPGLYLDVEPLRSYPYKSLAAHLLGYLGQISDSQLEQNGYRGYLPGTMVGQSGLERAYESHLRGTPGIQRVEVDTYGRETRQLAAKPPQPGTDLVTTLDFDLQRIAEELLDTEGYTGSIVVLDPRNGQILAMASRPAFDPNIFASRLSDAAWNALATHPKHPLHNRAIQGQYPPGSVFKMITAIAALEEGVATEHTTVCCTGHYAYGRRLYRDWKPTGHGCITLYEALAQSCDVYFYHMGQELGIDRLARYAKAFGFGQLTGFAPQSESRGLVPSSPWKRRTRGEPWYGGETLSVAIGQGYISVTPLQVANFIAALANGHTLYRPYAVLRQQSPAGTVLDVFKPKIIRQLDFQPQHIKALVKGMWGVVNDPRGTGRRARHPDIDIAGKTGTAQVVRLGKERGAKGQERLPEHQRDHAWFTAFAPVDDPRIVVVVMIEHAGKGGSQFAEFAKTLIESYLQGQTTLPSDLAVKAH
jgi:penicillin-binding protein 2